MNVKKFNKKKIVTFMLIFVISILILTTFRGARATLFVLGFIVLNVILTLYKRYFYLPIEFEIISVGIVLSSIKFGLIAGLTVAIVGGIAYAIYCTSFSPFTFPMLLGYALMALIAYFFSGVNMTYLGIGANIIHNLFIFVIYHFVFRYDLWKNIMYSGSNVLINIILFSNIAPFIFRIMG